MRETKIEMKEIVYRSPRVILRIMTMIAIK